MYVYAYIHTYIQGGATDGDGGGELGGQAPAGHADSSREAARARARRGRATRGPIISDSSCRPGMHLHSICVRGIMFGDGRGGAAAVGLTACAASERAHVGFWPD